ncbi:glycosyltransferase family 2 protein [Octadecabacter sp. B2R22]|uniref:glycosyltransferase family 2 protein n=1 Tax=Octadecabacter sp. B2R22 TaxID=2841570 RepID=UPI001C07F568|nr:glycosyltransferase family 2 protein [Octadecabacter sp. B2R22]MBU2994087.1 glycosyltransferase family 2 protein [Octadecabacter sp. B2R22]
MTTPTNTADLPRVTIILATYNGAKYVQQQLDSYVAQTDVDWDLWISDDGSSDDTMTILKTFAKENGHNRTIKILAGPGEGPAANFMSVLVHPDLPQDQPAALSDQDDVWLPNKLSTSLTTLSFTAGPALFSNQSYHTDTDLNVIGHSTPPTRGPFFENALVQNIASGHSLVLNTEALSIVRQAGLPEGIPYHDWWLYQLISGVGGTIHIDTARLIYYRQHASNAMGAHDGLRAGLIRLTQVFGKTYGAWVATNLRALSKVSPLLTPANRDIVRRLETAPKGPARLKAFYAARIRRQNRITTALLYLAVALGRV